MTSLADPAFVDQLVTRLGNLSDSFQVALGERHAAPANTFMHPIFGALTREEWLIWGYRHTGHHPRQFAL
jgi:hypothetical protein